MVVENSQRASVERKILVAEEIKHSASPLRLVEKSPCGFWKQQTSLCSWDLGLFQGKCFLPSDLLCWIVLLPLSISERQVQRSHQWKFCPKLGGDEDSRREPARGAAVGNTSEPRQWRVCTKIPQIQIHHFAIFHMAIKSLFVIRKWKRHAPQACLCSRRWKWNKTTSCLVRVKLTVAA